MVGVKGLKPSTSRSQTERAINCATPRYGVVLGRLYRILSDISSGILEDTMKKTLHRAFNSKKIRFGAVGAVNTAVDFVVLNVLVGVFEFMIIPANIASTTAAMLTSFGLNKKVVFREGNGSAVRQLLLFMGVTLTAIWIVQSGVMFGVFQLLDHMTGWNQTLLLNVAKLCGISAGMIWNYVWYSKVVFRSS